MTIKKMTIGIIAATALAFSAVAIIHKPAGAALAKTPAAKGFAVVELFTSEGCSSCPSADAVVARLVNKKPENVYVLAYHVDYWDRLGWKDAFSDKMYSQRQSHYADKFGEGSVYTPQIIVNGNTQFVGSDESKLSKAIKDNLAATVENTLNISTAKNGDSAVVDYTIAGNSSLILTVALVQPEATTIVKRGENGGRTLHHVNIVRGLSTITAKDKGRVALKIPAAGNAEPFYIVAFTQATNSLQVLGVMQKPL